MHSYLSKNLLKKEDGGIKISSKLRVQLWELYIGIGVKQTTCPLCGLHDLMGPTQNSGFQACHIVANKFSPSTTGSGVMDVFYLFPGCPTCNNECADQCLLDFLYVRMRYKELRTMIRNIFRAFTAMHEKELAQHEGLCWRVLDHLYGSKKFPAGGGIENKWAIYQMANAEQMEEINKDIKHLTEQLSQRVTLLNKLACSEIKPFTLV